MLWEYLRMMDSMQANTWHVDSRRKDWPEKSDQNSESSEPVLENSTSFSVSLRSLGEAPLALTKNDDYTTLIRIFYSI